MIREEWLMLLTDKLRPMFEEAGVPLPECIRCSCGWPWGSKTALAQCWARHLADDKINQIFVAPTLVKSFKVAEVMVHELLHAALPDKVGHGKPFKKGMKALGLEGKAKATEAGKELAERLHAILATMEPYPHAKLHVNDRKKQGTRMLKLTCSDCGYLVRTTAQWIETGLPTCCCGGEFVQEKVVE